MKEEDIAWAKAINAENKDSPAPLRRNITSDERARTFRWDYSIHSSAWEMYKDHWLITCTGQLQKLLTGPLRVSYCVHTWRRFQQRLPTINHSLKRSRRLVFILILLSTQNDVIKLITVDPKVEKTHNDSENRLLMSRQSRIVILVNHVRQRFKLEAKAHVVRRILQFSANSFFSKLFLEFLESWRF